MSWMNRCLGSFKYCALVRRVSGPDTHCLQRFIGGFALLVWLLGHNGHSVFPLGAVSLFSLGHGAGTRGDGGCCWDQQWWLRAAGFRGCRGKLGSICLGTTVDPPRPWVGGDRGIWAPVFGVIRQVGERAFFWTCTVWCYSKLFYKGGESTLLMWWIFRFYHILQE